MNDLDLSALDVQPAWEATVLAVPIRRSSTPRMAVSADGWSLALLNPPRAAHHDLLREARKALDELHAMPVGSTCTVLGVLPVCRLSETLFVLHDPEAPDYDDGSAAIRARAMAVWAADCLRNAFEQADRAMGDRNP